MNGAAARPAERRGRGGPQRPRGGEQATSWSWTRKEDRDCEDTAHAGSSLGNAQAKRGPSRPAASGCAAPPDPARPRSKRTAGHAEPPALPPASSSFLPLPSPPPRGACAVPTNYNSREPSRGRLGTSRGCAHRGGASGADARDERGGFAGDECRFAGCREVTGAD